jgi:hypothetical protein
MKPPSNARESVAPPVQSTDVHSATAKGKDATSPRELDVSAEIASETSSQPRPDSFGSNTPEPEQPPKLTEAQLDRVWQHFLHEDEVFNSRFNSWIALHAMLFALVTFLVGRPTPSTQESALTRGIAGIALLLGIIWAYTQGKQRYVFEGLRSRVRQLLPEINQGIAERTASIWKTSNLRLLAGVPWLIVLAWALVLIVLI